MQIKQKNHDKFHYQRKKYIIPHFAYRTAKSVIAGYEQLQKMEKGKYFVDAIESALQIVPKEYRKGVMGKLVRDDAFPLDASMDTYYDWCAKYVREVARKLELI